MEKVYVAVGSDLQDGFATLEWALRKWNSHSTSIVIIHATNIISNDFVYTPFGKLPASSVSDEKLGVLRKYEEDKTNKLLSKYMAFCGKVKAEILKIEKHDEPIHKVIIDLISGVHITKLVLGMTFLKSSAGRSKSAISGSFYVHRNKPEFCELFIVCGGKLVFLREENDGLMEDDQGVMVARTRGKASFKGWFGKMFAESPTSHHTHGSSTSSTIADSLNSLNQWENYADEIENYFQQLLSLNLDEQDCEDENNPTEQEMPENSDSDMSGAEKFGALKIKLEEAHETIQLKRKEAKDHVERHGRAEWAICLSTRRAEELEVHINEEISNRIDIRKELDASKEQIYEVRSDVEESKSRLRSLLELQTELSKKLQLSSLSRSRVEAQLENVAIARAEMVREIEELRRQRDVLQRRIEFCREKEAIGTASRLSELICSYREYTPEVIKLATDDFSEHLRMKTGGDLTNVFKGRINHATVAIKMVNSAKGLSQEAFQIEVKLLNRIRHSHIVAVIGFCSELRCMVFEYMHNGSLRDMLFSSHRNSRRRDCALRWHDRVRIAAEVCSALAFLHLNEPRPIFHGSLNASNILLDRNMVAKIHGLRLTPSHEEQDMRSDVRAFGLLVLQLLTGRNWSGLVEEAMAMDRGALIQVLDEIAGEWPLDLAEELAVIAMRCVCINMDLRMGTIMGELNELRKKADDIVARTGCKVGSDEGAHMEDTNVVVPGVFICPIFQEVMKNPHVAADGFSYELEAIEEWLGTGHDTSPMTNLRLRHKQLTPNHTLRSLIQDWLNKRSTSPS